MPSPSGIARHFSAVCLFVLIAACQSTGPTTVPGTPQPGTEVGDIAPDFSTTLLNGSVVSLKSLHGKVVLVNFWATWCGPCRSEMPLIQQFATTQNTNDFKVLAMNYKESASTILPFTDQYGLKFDVGLDPQGKITQSYHVQQYPSSYIIGRDGIIRARRFGQFTLETLTSAVSDALKS